MKVCKLIIMLALSMVLCACAGKQQTSETQEKEKENAGVSRIEGASIETVQKEAKVSSDYESIVVNSIQMSAQMATEYPETASQLQSSTLSYLKEKKMYKRVEAGTSKDSQPNANTLIADIKIVDMRIVSDGARMWGGVMAGSTYIEVYLKLTEASSKKVIHEKLIGTSYNAFAATYASGAEKSLAVDMGKIIGEYLCVVVPGKAKSGTSTVEQGKKKDTVRKKRTK